jgi:hypothetical protein
MDSWRKHRETDLERELRAQRPVPRADLVQRVTRMVSARPTRASLLPKIGIALAAASILAASLGVAGAVGYAKKSVETFGHSVVHVVQAPSAHFDKGGGKGPGGGSGGGNSGNSGHGSSGPGGGSGGGNNPGGGSGGGKSGGGSGGGNNGNNGHDNGGGNKGGGSGNGGNNNGHDNGGGKGGGGDQGGGGGSGNQGGGGGNQGGGGSGNQGGGGGKQGGGGSGNQGGGGGNQGGGGSGNQGGGGGGDGDGWGHDPFHHEYGHTVPICENGQVIYVPVGEYFYRLLHGDTPAPCPPPPHRWHH